MIGGFFFFSEFIDVVVELGELRLETFSESDLIDDLVGERLGIGEGSRECSPVVEDGLVEGGTAGHLSEFISEIEGFGDGEVGLESDEGCVLDEEFLGDLSSSFCDEAVDVPLEFLGDLDFGEEDGLLDLGFGADLHGLEESARHGDDLVTAAMDVIIMDFSVEDIGAESSDLFAGEDTVGGGFLEGDNDGVLDLIEVLDGLGRVYEDVGVGVEGSEGPDLLGVVSVPVKIVDEFVSELLGFEIDLGIFSEVEEILGE